MSITRELVKSLVIYDQNSGEMVWRYRDGNPSFNAQCAGRNIGCEYGGGYLMTSIKGKQILAHRLAFIYMTGSCPKVVDHIDGNPRNNSWSNLREATQAQNAANQRSARNSSSQFLGVCWDIENSKWIAHITKNKKQKAEIFRKIRF